MHRCISEASIAQALTDWQMGKLKPVESKTRTHNGRVGSARRRADGGAGRRWAKQGADISVALEANSPSGPPAHCRQLFRTSLRKHEQRKSYVNRWRNKTRGWPAVYHRLIRGLSPGPRALFVAGCWPVYRRLFVSVNPFHARHVREFK